jgi:hypothetical protein
VADFCNAHPRAHPAVQTCASIWAVWGASPGLWSCLVSGTTVGALQGRVAWGASVPPEGIRWRDGMDQSIERRAPRA